ncbi:reverse transcriptase zinc-binding domain-containing protein [Artemisia annua]|uniref:Reverse transcriptase zinc-binding domain-containing protein n=1 Tax=Artemisia annua TaxID=35608 RepID=A0A2U1PRA7_ARTAN|nr:reverse transcriptase zinc-binding domain-containing protein [Artemisia annua]
MWYDQWSTIGILGEVLSTRNIHNARLSENLKVSEMIVNEQWRWPNSWREQFPMLVNLNVPKLNPQKQDITMWRCANGSLNEFSSRIAWEHISQNYEKVKWCNVVWFSQCNPRMAFVLWMAVKRRLQTQDRVMKCPRPTLVGCFKLNLIVASPKEYNMLSLSPKQCRGFESSFRMDFESIIWWLDG